MHARKTARDAFFPSQEDDAFFAARRGDIVFRDAGVRTFADRVGKDLRPAHLAALAFIHQVLHTVVDAYRERHPDSFERFGSTLRRTLGPQQARRAVIEFLSTFPPPRVYRTSKGEGDDTPELYLERTPGLELELDAEILLLWVTNQNPAYEPVRTIVGDQDFGATYRAFVTEARLFFADEPAFGPNGETLIELLLAPGKRHPSSVFDQVDFIDQSWVEPLGLDVSPLTQRRVGVQDLRTEEDKWFSRPGGPGPGEPLMEPLRFRPKKDEEPARFSPDLGWMPTVVLMAKTVYVWLDQLTKKYERHVWQLDQIPDEELDILAERGITGLWLIGLFERSRASRRIKQIRGDHDAIASAYSLRAYEIAEDLGGVPAFMDLKARAAKRGIRLAADMVPNHVGIDGDWVLNHPDWFLQAPKPPFPGYRFGGPDLSDDPRVAVSIEEGYWDHTDAAVVFRRHDRWTGESRFLYHGNDGTSTPWNDTAQLDYSRADVRSAVIETILHVAQMFPIIRFDAAMTLAKRHIQRLWFPLPGQGGTAVPSRADYSMTQEEFDAAIPVEFWREVVDAVAARAPDTLLLAEAFWMMEGYFVRTLGMHRVYNSAFMNMLKREENAKYRETIRNVLDFDAEILKRFVNFMNNPDEEPAALQFGENDKYFGTCVLMSTMPGLPMFGHGQIEGFREKYGMEYRRARFDEPVNAPLVERHEKEIFPLLHKRYLFAGVDRFALYDFVTEGGEVDEDVYAYSNGAGGERVLVLFNNRYKNTRGRVHHSTHRGSLARELDLGHMRGEWLVMRDASHGLEYLYPMREALAFGLTWRLGGFEYHVFTDFRAVTATRSMPFDRLAAELAGRGVPDVEAAARELHLRPVHMPLRAACSPGHIAYLASRVTSGGAPDAVALAALEERLGHVADGVDWMLSQRARRDVTVERAPVLEAAATRFEALRAAHASAPAASWQLELLLVWIQVEATLDLLDAVEQGPEAMTMMPPTFDEDVPSILVPSPPSTPTFDAAPASAPAPAPAPASAPAPAPAPAPASTLAPAKEPPSERDETETPEHSEAAELESTPLAEEQPVEKADEPPSPSVSEDVAKLDAAEPDLPAADTERTIEAPPSEPAIVVMQAPSTWSAREALIDDWELATPLVDAFSAACALDEAKRRAALVLLAATLPMGPLGPALRLAMGAPRGQAFLNVHEADGALWLVKERYEELARLLADREAAAGRMTREAADAEVTTLAELAAREGYRAERIAVRLGPAPSDDTLVVR